MVAKKDPTGTYTDRTNLFYFAPFLAVSIAIQRPSINWVSWTLTLNLKMKKPEDLLVVSRVSPIFFRHITITRYDAL